MAQSSPDLILVDWNMPGQSGVSFVRRVRSEPAHRLIPVIMITARDHEQDKVLAFEAGVDDYVTKPFKVREMLARVEALLRRSAASAPTQRIEIDGLCLDHECRQVKVSEKEIALGPTEYKLLHFLVSHPMRVHSRQQLLNHVWGDTAELQDRTVDAYIGRLRSLIHATGHHPCIETVRSTGYRFIKRSEAVVNMRTGHDRRQGDRRATPRDVVNG
jgi:two-component system phosphate regulon response regulator PhoB